MTNKIWNLVLIFSVVRCTLFVPKDIDLRELKEVPKEITCSKPARLQLFSNQTIINDNFHKFHKNQKNPLNETSLIAAWMLIQMNYRPDLTSENSQFLATIIKNDKTYVFDSYSKKHKYINFISYFNKKFSGSHSLTQIAEVIKRIHPKDFKISGDFSFYLKQNLEKIKTSKILSGYFLRGTEYLRKNERLKPLNYSFIVKRAKPQKFTQVKLVEKGQLFCNTSQFKTVKESAKSNSFSIKIGNFVAMLSTSQKNVFSPGDNFFFKTSMTNFPKTLCYFKSKVSSWMISDFGRSPYQHLDHLSQYKVNASVDRAEFSEYLNFSRHLVLKNPMRLIYESNRGTTAQLDKLLKFDIPIYYSAKLGNIFGLVKDKNAYLFKDNRIPNEIKCSN